MFDYLKHAFASPKDACKAAEEQWQKKLITVDQYNQCVMTAHKSQETARRVVYGVGIAALVGVWLLVRK